MTHAEEVMATVRASGVTLGEARMEVTHSLIEAGYSFHTATALLATYDVLLLDAAGQAVGCPATINVVNMTGAAGMPWDCIFIAGHDGPHQDSTTGTRWDQT